MKLKDMLKDFKIFVTNEEQQILDQMEHIRPIEAYNERERFVIENLVRKSLVSKVKRENTYMVVKNEQQEISKSIKKFS